MRVSDAKLAEVRERGFAIIENFLDAETLAAAQAALWNVYPTPETYFADPSAHPKLASSQFAGLRLFPYAAWELSRIPVYPDLVNAAERFLGSTDLEIYKVELWAKYAGAIDYEQPHHRDFGNHTLVVPRKDGVHTQMTTFILLSDVTEADAPTKLAPLEHTRDMPFSSRLLPKGALADVEEPAIGPAGSLLIYKTDVMHRGSDFTAPGRSRFVMLVDFQERGWRWNGKMSWPDHADKPGMRQAIINMSVRERDLFGWPPVGSDYWNRQTLDDVAARYPGIDLSAYAAAAETGAV